MIQFPQPNSIRAIRAKNRIEAAARTGHPLDNLPLVEAACRLAPQLYALRGELYNVNGQWLTLPASTRMHYVDLCAGLLREVEPS